MTRSRIEETVLGMNLGERVGFAIGDVESAYPATGMNLMHAIALDRGGNRPEPAMSSDDHLRQFCARNGFDVWRDDFNHRYEVERRRVACACCGGRRLRPQVESVPQVRPDGSLGLVNVAMQYLRCEHCSGSGSSAWSGDPDARFGDHSASDAWIARKRLERERAASNA